MNLLLIILLTIVVITAGIYCWRKKQRESLVENILATLAKKLSSVSVTIEACAPGAMIRKMRAEGVGVTLIYVWPNEKNELALPRVLSGMMMDAIEWRGDKFSPVEFTIVHGMEDGAQQKNVLGYQITLWIKNASPVRVKGIISKYTLTRSIHLSCFNTVIAMIGGAP